ncbi:cytochrome P450 [Stipitochalara longipes BDJ]|nr:cytochrome P450 [Stipitochalara longipes BDJ]
MMVFLPLQTQNFLCLTPISAGILLVVVGYLLYIFYHAYATPLRNVPGPWYAKFTHLWLKVQVLGGRRVHYIHELHQRYGPIVRIAPAEIAVADSASFREIHRIKSGYLKSPWYQEFGPPGVFTMIDPHQHAKRRQLLARGFSKSYLRQNWEHVVKEKAEMAVGKIGRDAERGTADILKWWTFYTTDTVGHLSFGESFRMLEQEEKNTYIHVLESVLMMSGIQTELPFLRYCKYLPISSIRRLFTGDDYVLEYGTRAISNANGQDGHTSNVFSTILAESEKDGSALSNMDVNLEAGNFIVAGSDTTAITLTYLIWAVLKQPALQRALENEVHGLAPDFTDTDLEFLPLLNAVIEETLRLYGAAPASLPRTTPVGGATLSGYLIPGGTTVSTQAYTIHRDSSLFPNPDVFDPSRFLQREMLSANTSAALHAFGAGSRVCLGVHLARMELRIAACLFFRECVGATLADSCTDESMEMENYFLIAPKSHRCEIKLEVRGF